MKNSDLVRKSECKLTFDNPFGPDPVIFANRDVPIESAAVSELSEFLEVSGTVELLTRVSLYNTLSSEVSRF